MTDRLKAAANQQWLTNIVSLYAVEPGVYLDRFILSPLLAALRAMPQLPSLPEQREAIHGMLADLLEAFPYLMSSARAERLMFHLPGTDCVGPSRSSPRMATPSSISSTTRPVCCAVSIRTSRARASRSGMTGS